MNPHNLPVYSHKKRLLKTLKKHQVVVIESPTGSGKTTQLPLILHEAGYTSQAVVGVTQPRRLAAVSVCHYIANQIQQEVGTLVGFKMRFEDQTSPETRLKILTDGTLLQEMKSDPLLSRYTVLMIDEAHERTLNIDFLLGLLKSILPQRPDLKIIISSATLNPKAFSRYFHNCPIVTIKSPMYPVQVRYAPPAIEGDYDLLLAKIISTVSSIIKEDSSGDILVFCTGEKMIKDCVAGLTRASSSQKIQILPLYGRLGREEQERVLLPPYPGHKKVVFSTNVAETSLTIDGITAVIDTGMAKMNFYNPQSFTSSLIERRISQASANQRKGRAGRTQPGICYRLYSEESFQESNAYTQEEIYRTDLAEVVLRMAEVGIRHFETFPFLCPPEAKGLHGAVETLRLLDAIDAENKLTEIGRMMLPYPLMPRQARMIVEAIQCYPDVLKEVMIVAAFLSTNDPFLFPQGEETEAREAQLAFRSDRYGDFGSYLNLYRKYQASQNRKNFTEQHYLDQKIMNEILAIVDQLESITSEKGIFIGQGGSPADCLKSCARGLLPFICVKEGRFNYRSIGMDRIVIHPGSVLFRQNPPFIVAGEIVHTSRIYARSVAPLRKEWLTDIHPNLPSLLLENSRKPHRHEERSRSTKQGKKDQTNQLWIAGKAFPLSRSLGKGNKKLAILEWSVLHPLLKTAHKDYLPDFGTMRGMLLFGEKKLLSDDKVNTILKVALLLDPRQDFLDTPPKGHFYLHEASQEEKLMAQLALIMKVSTTSKHSRRASLGFVCLSGDGADHYWFKIIHSFHGAASVSLKSLEDLVNQRGKTLSKKQTKILKETQKRLESYLH